MGRNLSPGFACLSRSEVLRRLHEGHIGGDAMKSLARQSVSWPSMDRDIAALVKRCDECCKSKNYSKKIPTSWPEETQKWSRVHIDLAGPLDGGHMALVLVDAFSRWPEVHLMSSTTATEVMKRLRRTFSQEGVPNTLVSDNGPQFACEEMEKWLSHIGCKHILTPPYHPRSNGLAERFVRTLKNHIRCGRGKDLQSVVDRFLLQYRNSSHSTTGVAPAVLMRGKLLRSPITALSGIGDKVWVRKHLDKDQPWKDAEVIGLEGRSLLKVLDEDSRTQRFHVEDTKERVSDLLVPSDEPSKTSDFPEPATPKEQIVDGSEDTPVREEQRDHPQRIRKKPQCLGIDC